MLLILVHVARYVFSVVMIMVVGLEDGSFVSLTASNTIVVTHNISKLIEGLKDVDTNSSIEPCGFKHPQVLIVVATLRKLERCFQSLLFLQLTFMQFLIKDIYVLVYILFYDFHYLNELFNSFAYIVS